MYINNSCSVVFMYNRLLLVSARGLYLREIINKIAMQILKYKFICLYLLSTKFSVRRKQLHTAWNFLAL